MGVWLPNLGGGGKDDDGKGEGKESNTGLGVTLGKMLVPILFNPSLSLNDRQEHPSPRIQRMH